MEKYMVRTENLKKYYRLGENTVRALDGVDFDVREREFIAVIGKSGSGKSTLLHLIGGLDVPMSGEVYVDGRKLSDMDREQLAIFRRRKVGFVFQNYNLVPDLNVYENVVLPIELDGKRIDKEFVKEILELLQIADKTEALPGMLSGGQQQRVAIARAVAAKPAIILADEPTGNLDTASGHDVMGLLKVAAKQFQQTVILITHDRDIAQMADRIVHIEDGRIVGSKDTAPGTKEVIRMLANNNRKVIDRMAAGSLKHNRGRNLIIFLSIVLASFMLFSIFTVGITYFQMQKVQNIRLNGGEYDAVMYGITPEQREKCENDPDIRRVGILAMSGYLEATQGTTRWRQPVSGVIRSYGMRLWPLPGNG